MVSLRLLLSVLAALVPSALTYPEGPPVDDEHPKLCTDMIPTGHGVSAMTENHPFELVVAGNCYKPGVGLPVFVRLNKTDNSEPYLEGIFVQARSYASGQINRSENVGTFDVLNDPELKTLPCFAKKDSAVGQAKEGHFFCKRFDWMAPDSMNDDVIFHATIVRNKERFWKDVMSVAVHYDNNCSPNPSTVVCEKVEQTSGSGQMYMLLFTWLTSASVAMLAL